VVVGGKTVKYPLPTSSGFAGLLGTGLSQKYSMHSHPGSLEKILLWRGRKCLLIKWLKLCLRAWNSVASPTNSFCV
jgi:hypothetical protein